MGLIILPWMAVLALAWLAVASCLAFGSWFIARQFPFGRVIGPALAAATMFLCWYVPNMRAFAKQEQIDRITSDCGFNVIAAVDNVQGILIESGSYSESASSFDHVTKHYAPVEFRSYGGQLQQYASLGRPNSPAQPVDIAQPTQRYGIRVRETSNDILVRQEEQIVDFGIDRVLARNVTYSQISPPPLSTLTEIALYHLTVQPRICPNAIAYSREVQVPLVLRPAARGGSGVRRE
jgi:hypothetical protein